MSRVTDVAQEFGDRLSRTAVVRKRVEPAEDGQTADCAERASV